MKVQVCVRRLLENPSFGDVHTHFVIWSSRLEEAIFAKNVHSVLLCIKKRCSLDMFQAGHNTEVRQPWASDNTPTHKLWSQKVRWCKKNWPDKQREIEPPRWPWWWSYTNTQTCSLLNHCIYNHHWSCWENQISQTHMHTKKGPLRNSAKPEQQNPWRKPPSVNIDLKK